MKRVLAKIATVAATILACHGCNGAPERSQAAENAAAGAMAPAVASSPQADINASLALNQYADMDNYLEDRPAADPAPPAGR